jgi:ribosomal protein L44E
MTVQCCVCRKYRVKNSWKRAANVEGDVSHTYCPVCKEQALKEIERGTKAIAVGQ